MPDLFYIIISSFGIRDLIDIAIVAFVIYKILGFIRETRAEQLVKGLLILLAAAFLSDILNLYTLSWILIGAMQFGVIALVVVFQPELRRGLEYVGRSKFIKPQFAHIDKDKAKAATAAIIKAIDFFSTTKTGALLILEREIALNDIAESGVTIDSDISTELLKNIFYEGAPLHDGAAIIRNARLYAAGCMLPLTESKSLSMDLGTRHRAGIGITEYSDAVALIVSEESGIISTAKDGTLTRFLDVKTVEKTLLNLFLAEKEETTNLFGVLNLFKRKKDAEE
ncbi:MAG: diadenylate cyclase CdaA [Clostridiales Family XIII bacterium]|jgi:diadenylate cyclase|nr:diadenylate cyclase CdaA [Clostridiales Family XIII bacterium]